MNKHEYPKERKKPERIPLNKERYDMICVQVKRLFWEESVRAAEHHIRLRKGGKQ